jgi:general secretion pathway protein L
VVAVVPLQALSWHQVTLPQGSLPRSWRGEGSRRLRAILDGLLEDQLLDDPAQLHLAIQPQPQTGEPLWVAACDRAWLTAALAVLAQAGYQASRIVPESSPQALAQSIEVTGQLEQPWVSGMDRQGVGLLACALTATAVEWLPPDAPVMAEPAVAVLAEKLFQRPVTLQQRGARLLLAALAPWDLAQFEFTNAQRDQRWAQISQGVQSFLRAPAWRPARWALALLVLGNLIGLNAWALRQQGSLQTQRDAVRAVLKDTFPKIPVVVDAPLQMAREVAELQRASGSAAGSDMESILSSFSALAPAGYAPTAIEYAAGELRLSGPALGAPEQAQITAGLKALGLSASLQGSQWLIHAGVTP